MAERVALYRKRQKENNPERYEAYLTKQRIASKRRRTEFKQELTKKNLTPELIEKRDKQREQNCIRQKTFLAKKKLNNVDTVKGITNPVSKVENKAGNQWKRDKNKQYKQRDRETLPKKAWRKKKDSEKKKMKREKDRANRETEIFQTEKNEMNYTKIECKTMPNNAYQYAAVIQSLEKNCSPRKRQALSKLKRNDKRTCLDETFEEVALLAKTNSKAIKYEITRRLVKSKVSVCKQLGISMSTFVLFHLVSS